LVSPGTSLIVLEGLQQYVEHKIAPPKSLPEMRTKYFAMIENQQQKEKKRVADKLEQVVAIWQKRVDWWNTEFKCPKDFKYKSSEQKPVSGAEEFHPTMHTNRGGVYTSPAPAARPRVPRGMEISNRADRGMVAGNMLSPAPALQAEAPVKGRSQGVVSSHEPEDLAKIEVETTVAPSPSREGTI